MGSTKHCSSTELTRPHIFQTLISVLRSPEGLQLQQMKGLYYLLNQLSLKMDMEFNQDGFKVMYEDMHTISDILFNKLDAKFGCYFCALLDDSVTQADGQADSITNMSTDMEELTLLLRCCMVILTLLVSRETVLLEKSRVLLSILGRILSLNITGGKERNSISSKKSVSPFLCAVLEVFADELLTGESLGTYLMLADSTSLTNAFHFVPGDTEMVLEVISCHFILSVLDEQAFEDFIKRLFWQHGKDFRVPELSLTAALLLLLDPIILSAPKLFQAHLILLVSEAINIDMSSESFRPDLRIMGLYITAFENAIILYTRQMSGLHMDGPPLDAKCSFVKSSMLGRNCQPSFELYVKDVTRDKIYQSVTKSNDLLGSGLFNMFLRTKSELVASSIAYMEENQHILDELCKDKILSILGGIIQRASDDDFSDTELYMKWDTSPQGTCLLAAILKLMSGSLLQAVWCARHIRKLGSPETSDDSTSCKEYDFVTDIIRCFQHFKVCLPIEKFLRDVMKTQPMKHKESKWILLLFSGLLSLSFVSGLDFLIRNHIFMIMTLLNLFSLEDDDLAVRKPLLGSGSESCLNKFSSVQVREVQSCSKRTRKLASNFQRIQTVRLSTDTPPNFHQNTRENQVRTSENICILNLKESVLGMGEETKRTCNGENYLKAVVEGSHKSFDFDGLEDFIECKKGKDYSAWLKSRQRYRKWKAGKMVGVRWKKMERMWKLIKGKKTVV